MACVDMRKLLFEYKNMKKKMWSTSVVLKNIPNVNKHPMGENSPCHGLML
jgi:hypothetical protein